MVDRERVLAKLDELEGYLKELASIAPKSFKEYQQVEKKRTCERLLQISVEAVIDICSLFVVGLRLGLPSEEADLFEKLEKEKLLSKSMAKKLKSMKGFRNILVHEYGKIDDDIVYDTVRNGTDDFRTFKREMLKALKKGT